MIVIGSSDTPTWGQLDDILAIIHVRPGDLVYGMTREEKEDTHVSLTLLKAKELHARLGATIAAVAEAQQQVRGGRHAR